MKQAAGISRSQRIAPGTNIEITERSKARATVLLFTLCMCVWGINNMHRGNAPVSNTCSMMYESLYGCWS